jgi:hypothetical protein
MRFLPLAFLAVPLAAVSIQAQSLTSSSFVVAVVDPGGAVIPGATVSARASGSNNIVASALADSAGEARLVLAPGIYDISVVSMGFAQFRISGFDIAAGSLTVKVTIASSGWGPIVNPRDQYLIPTLDATLSALLTESPVPSFPLAAVKFHRRSR